LDFNDAIHTLTDNRSFSQDWTYKAIGVAGLPFTGVGWFAYIEAIKFREQFICFSVRHHALNTASSFSVCYKF
jgi:hypothetical protein